MYIERLDGLNVSDSPKAGGKGASLGEMLQAGIQVPNGFVVLTSGFEAFLRETDLGPEIEGILGGVNIEVIHTVESASERIQALVLAEKMPSDIKEEIETHFRELGAEYVAVRSSATAEDGANAAWAGQLDTFLNVTGEQLVERVQYCWASLFTPRAIYYRFEKGMHKEHVSVAVVIQKMVNSEKSGIAFSVHPVTQDPDQLIIEAGFGLGEAIVSGQVTPDAYVVRKSNREIVDINVNHQTKALYRAMGGGNEWRDLADGGNEQVLSSEEITILAEQIIRIENHYGFPCDIEWAQEAGDFYITQSRPITTLREGEAGSTERTTNGQTLSKIFSREKPLFYFCLWNDSDRLGWRKFLGYEVKNNVFRILEKGKKGSVWYSKLELDQIDRLLTKCVNEDAEFIPRLRGTLDMNWNTISPYLEGGKKLQSGTELELYFAALVAWWSALTTAWTLPDLDGVPMEAKKAILEYRTHSEKFTEKMSNIMSRYWEEAHPELAHFSFFITPEEAAEFEAGDMTLLEIWQRRTRGCVMINREVFPLEDENEELQKRGLLLEQEDVEGVTAVRGTTAQEGIGRGRVCKILSFADASKFKDGDVLVTEMTNPELVPIMRRASAFVTDEGGSMCHAAIVARELKIPCVTGTSIATQIFKDGDLVEVNANVGQVNLIERAEDEEVQLQANHYKYYGFWKQKMLTNSYWAYSFNSEIVREMGLEMTVPGSLIATEGHVLAEVGAIDKMRAQYGSRIAARDEKFFDRVKRVTDDVCERAMNTSTQCAGQKPSLSIFEKIDGALNDVNFVWLLAAGYFVVEAEVKLQEKVIEKSVPAEEVIHLIPSFRTLLTEQQEDVGRLRILVKGKTREEIQNDQGLNVKLEEHVEKFAWIETANFIGGPFTKEKLIDLIVMGSEEGHGYEARYVPDEELAFYLRTMSISGYIKQICAETFSKISFIVRPFFEQLAQQMELTYEELIDLNRDELRAYFQGSLTHEEAKTYIQKRQKNAYVLYRTETENKKLENDSTVAEFVEKLVPRADKDANEITGQVGNPGKVKGKVCVVLNSDEFHKFETGNILVSTMTTPDFVVLMQKSAAIVTDIGGLLCHAAIVSRELNKPCVIGTKFATQILKDGDEVEVDAAVGLVRIIK